MDLQKKVYELFENQLVIWDLARKNYENLKTAEKKIVHFQGFSITLLHNPARIISTAAKLDKASLASRKCFLCKENMDENELGIELENFTIHLNPYPIFPLHLVIASKLHIPQILDGYLSDFLQVTKLLPNFAVFFNGIDCGASAPDHLHFQAAQKQFFPIINEYKKQEKFGKIKKNSFETYFLKNYLREVFCIKSADETEIFDILKNFTFKTFGQNSPKWNILAFYENGFWQIFVFPRNASRPWQYSAPEPKRLLVSPGTVEMSGIFILPQKSDFQRITKEDIIDIYSQVSLKKL